MKFEIIIVLLIGTFVAANSEIDKATDCNDIKLESSENCDISDYNKYVLCLRKRTKRHIDCSNQPCLDGNCSWDNNCSDCDCGSCETCENSYCTNNCCSSCCTNRCNTHLCCHKVCRSQCRTTSCRSSCKKSCENDLPSKHSSSVDVKNAVNLQSGHNITTVIHLNNLINNTNLIDVPINLNNSNINNITLNLEDQDQINVNSKNCCSVISPRQCVPTETYPFQECFHYRSRQCGNLCRSPIMHIEPHRICDVVPQGPPNCHEQLMYIPQPQPRCTYNSVWPYVQCGIQGMASCEGCYGHNFPQNCPPSCYHDFGSGPLYRQGPIGQPPFYPDPSSFMGSFPFPEPNHEMPFNMNAGTFGLDPEKTVKIRETNNANKKIKTLI